LIIDQFNIYVFLNLNPNFHNLYGTENGMPNYERKFCGKTRETELRSANETGRIGKDVHDSHRAHCPGPRGCRTYLNLIRTKPEIDPYPMDSKIFEIA
jgi:hypothetical protein